jgi:regulator of replication initiation timing
MILAEYINEPTCEVNIEMMKFQDASFSTIKNISESLAILNNDIQAKGRQIFDLVEDNNILRAEKERADAAELNNKILLKKLEDIESSRSWTITKPLRKAVRTVKGRKK